MPAGWNDLLQALPPGFAALVGEMPPGWAGRMHLEQLPQVGGLQS